MPIIFHLNIDLETYFDGIWDYLQTKYHYKGQPSAFPNFKISEKEAGMIDSLNVMARHLHETYPTVTDHYTGNSQTLTPDGWVPTGKAVL